MTTWYQQAMTPPLVIEVNVRIGIIPTEDHVQVLAEAKDPTNGVLIAQWAMPRTSMRNLPHAISEACTRAQTMADEIVEPFI